MVAAIHQLIPSPFARQGLHGCDDDLGADLVAFGFDDADWCIWADERQLLDCLSNQLVPVNEDQTAAAIGANPPAQQVGKGDRFSSAGR
jgi:hypothetical protein